MKFVFDALWTYKGEAEYTYIFSIFFHGKEHLKKSLEIQENARAADMSPNKYSIQTAHKLFLTYTFPRYSPYRVLPVTRLVVPPWGPGASNNSVTTMKSKVVPPSGGRGKLAAQLEKRIASSEEAFRGAFSSTGEATGEAEEEEKPEFL